MADQSIILDYWDEDPSDEPTVLLRYFYVDADAQIAAVQLRQAGIPSFITSSNSQTILPTGQGWIGLHVQQQNAAAAVDALREAELWEEPTPVDSSHRWTQVMVTIFILLFLIVAAVLLNLAGVFS